MKLYIWRFDYPEYSERIRMMQYKIRDPIFWRFVDSFELEPK